MSHRKLMIVALGMSIGGVALADDGPVGGKVPPTDPAQGIEKPDDKGTVVPKAPDTTLATTTGAKRIETCGFQSFVDQWPSHPKELVQAMLDKYGDPDEASASRLVWRNSGPWKRTIVYRDEVMHDFPRPHTDLLEQVLDYAVPLDKLVDLAKFDGSIVVDRTAGEVLVKGDDERMNLAAMNLADQLVNGKITVDEARTALARDSIAVAKKDTPKDGEKLLFDFTSSDTTFVDKPVKIRIK